MRWLSQYPQKNYIQVCEYTDMVGYDDRGPKYGSHSLFITYIENGRKFVEEYLDCCCASDEDLQYFYEYTIQEWLRSSAFKEIILLNSPQSIYIMIWVEKTTKSTYIKK
jgi:hypothetical protein